MRIVANVSGVRRDVLHLLRFRVVEINIGIRRGLTRLLERDEFPVVRDIAELVAGFVLVDDLRRRIKIDRRPFRINVEKLRVARVRREEEDFPVLAPFQKVSFRLLARGQVALFAVKLS